MDGDQDSNASSHLAAMQQQQKQQQQQQLWASLVAQMVKNLPAMQEIQV